MKFDNPQNYNHPTEKPIKLIEYLIKTYTDEKEIVFDPFMGSGTTGAIAKMLKRNFIGFEKDPFYIKVATKRIKHIKEIDDGSNSYLVEIKKPKVPFGNLIESNLIKIGEYLFSKNKKYRVKVLMNGSLKFKNIADLCLYFCLAYSEKENLNGHNLTLVCIVFRNLL